MKTRVNELLERTSKQQKAALAICIIIVGAIVLWFFDSGPTSQRSNTIQNNETTRIVADLTRGARAERSWLDISEDKFKDMDARLKRLEQERVKLEKDNALLEKRNQEMAENANQAIDTQAQEIERLRVQVEKIETAETPTGQTAQAEQNASNQALNALPNPIMENPFERARNSLAPQVRARTDLRTGSGAKTGQQAPSTASLIHFNLGSREGGIKSLDRYIPAGAYAPAEVISGVDAAVGVNAQADPRPVLFRITGPAVRAALGDTKQTSDIKGCIVIGAAFGDLSSEKVYARLQTMTCTRSNNQVFETEIQGYMAGAGKAGVRGVVVSREGDLVGQSFLAGAVGGIGSAASQSLEPTSIIGTTDTATAAQPISDILKSGIGQGLDNAGNRVSDYLIERAEQYQPVIIMQAGTKVELVFLKGVDLNLDGTIKTSKRDTKQ